MKRLLGVILVLALCVPIFGTTAQAPANTSMLSATATLVQGDRGNPDVKVWVNTAPGVYHCPGTRWYGNTKRGEYMKQAEAQKKGYRPAYGKVCR